LARMAVSAAAAAETNAYTTHDIVAPSLESNDG
jgi:hypothetical protein